MATFDAATGVMTFTMILLPQTLANALVLEISPDDGEYQSYSNKDMIKPALEAGYSYTYTITVKKTGLTLSGSTIENWNDGGSHAGDAKCSVSESHCRASGVRRRHAIYNKWCGSPRRNGQWHKTK